MHLDSHNYVIFSNDDATTSLQYNVVQEAAAAAAKKASRKKVERGERKGKIQICNIRSLLSWRLAVAYGSGTSSEESSSNRDKYALFHVYIFDRS